MTDNTQWTPSTMGRKGGNSTKANQPKDYYQKLVQKKIEKYGLKSRKQKEENK